MPGRSPGSVLENIASLSDLVTADVCFSDPFNRVQGQQAFLTIFADMYERLDNVTFQVHEITGGETAGYLHWTFSAGSKLTGSFTIDGVSRVLINSQGLVTEHHDYWDASELMQRLPVLGRVIRSIRQKMALPD